MGCKHRLPAEPRREKFRNFNALIPKREHDSTRDRCQKRRFWGIHHQIEREIHFGKTLILDGSQRNDPLVSRECVNQETRVFSLLNLGHIFIQFGIDFRAAITSKFPRDINENWMKIDYIFDYSSVKSYSWRISIKRSAGIVLIAQWCQWRNF